MADTEQQTESPELNREEIFALVGAGAVAVGTILPAVQPGFGEKQSLVDFANTATFIFSGSAGSVIWSVTRRRAHEAVGPGVLILLSLLVFGVFVWLENVRDPVETFFGSLKAEFRAMAWAVIGTGASAILLAGIRSRAHPACLHLSRQSHERIRAIGVTLAALGCSMGISLVNPFGGWAPADIRRLSNTYEGELQLLRWLWLGAATFCIVTCVQYPERALRVLQKAIRVAGLAFGFGIFVVLSMAVPETRYQTMLVGAGWTVLGMTFWLTEHASRIFARLKQLVITSPFVAVFGLLLILGEFEDLIFILYPPFAIAAGYVICRNTKHVDAAISAAVLTIGLPAFLMVFHGVENETSELLGLSAAEARFVATGICCLLGWAVFLSFQNDRVVSSDLAGVKTGFDANEPNEVNKE